MSKVIIIVGIIIVLIASVFFGKNLLSNFVGNQISQNPKTCESFKDNKDACYNSAAQKNKDSNLCAKISLQSGDIKSDSKDNCYSNVAEALDKAELCDQIQKMNGDGSRNNCYLNISVKTKNTDLCDKLTKDATVTQNGQQAAVSRDMCVGYIAKDSKNPALCEKVSVKTHQPNTISVESCYYALALDEKNLALCDKSGSIQADCIKEVNQKK